MPGEDHAKPKPSNLFHAIVICITLSCPASPVACRVYTWTGSPVSQLPPPYLTVLVVDDERISRRVATRMLRELGLRVLEADGAEEALDVFRISQQPIDLVLLDVVMPETDGVSLAEQILTHRPGQRIIFMSAYPAEVLAEHGLQDLEVLFLAKPYTMEELRAKVRQAMELPPSREVDPVWRARQQETRRQE
jgi:CheY-like chemotaxis protein